MVSPRGRKGFSFKKEGAGKQKKGDPTFYQEAKRVTKLSGGGIGLFEKGGGLQSVPSSAVFLTQRGRPCLPSIWLKE